MASYLPPELLRLANQALADLPSRLASSWQADLDALPYNYRVLLWLSWAAAGGLLLLVARSILAPGWARLMIALPLAVGNWMLPFKFDCVAEMATYLAIFNMTAALSSLKALGWALNRGPLVFPLNGLQFMAIYFLPITPQEGPPQEEPGAARGRSATGDSGSSSGPCDDDSQAKETGKAERRKQRSRLHESAGTPLENLRNCVLKLGTFLLICLVLINFGPALPRIAKSFLYGFTVYCGMGAAMDAAAAFAEGVLGLPIAPHFDNPYHSTSVAELWSKRWNLNVSNVFRMIFYDTIIEGKLVKDKRVSKPYSAWRRMAGLFASFFVSGVLHEALFWYCAHRIFGHQLLYFSIWPPLILLEGLWRRMLRRKGIRVPTWLAWLTVTLIVQTSADRLFWEPHYQLGTTAQALASIEATAPWLKLKRE